MRNILFLFLFTTMVSFAQSQPDSVVHKIRPAYFFSFGMGPMVGGGLNGTEQHADFGASVLQGIRAGRLSAGVGLGFDWYDEWKTIPLFGSASWDLFGKKNKVFAQLNYGYSFASMDKLGRGFGYKRGGGGEMFSPVIGYRVRHDALHISFSVGYKLQRVFTRYEYWTYTADSKPAFGYGLLPAPATETRTDMNRFVFTMAFGWR